MNRLFILAILFAFCSCSDADIVSEYEKDENSGEVAFNFPDATRAPIENTHVYVFNGVVPDIDSYVYRVPGATYTSNSMTMKVRAGTWNMVLVNADQSTLGQLNQPVLSPGATMHNTVMWATQASGGVLPSAPEIMTAHANSQGVTPDIMNYGTATLFRNVAMVKVVVKEAGGFAENSDHNVSLSNVPTTLSWAGGLLPNKNNPTVSSSPMRGNVTISADPQNATNQVSDTLYFIIPAHKGSDCLSPSPGDTTTSPLHISIDFKLAGSGRYEKADVVIGRRPQVNKILEVNLIVKAQLTVETQILDWAVEDVYADLSQTNLQVGKTTVGLSYKDTVVVKSSADFSIVNGAPWITTQKLPDGNVEITANIDTYETERSSHVDITSNNVTKRIFVTQRPDEGTLFVSPTGRIILSPTSPNKIVNITSLGGGWTLSGDTDFATLSKQTWAVAITNDPVTFTYPPTGTKHGNTNFTLKNNQRLEQMSLEVCNLYLDAPESITMGGKAGSLTCDDVKAIGGDSTFTVTGNTSGGWLTTSFDADGELVLTATAAPDDGNNRTCTITITHTNDPSYTKTITVIQDINMIVSDPFRFLVIKFTGHHLGSQDLDIAVGFDQNGFSSLDKTYMGFGTSSPFEYNNNKVLTWGADDNSNYKDGEAVYLDPYAIDVMEDATPLIPLPTTTPKQANELAQFIYIFCYAGYHSSTSSVSTDRTDILVNTYVENYPGEVVTMKPYRNTFTNEGGKEGLSESMEMTVGPKSGNNASYSARAAYVKMCIIRYDRIRHSAMVCFPREVQSGSTYTYYWDNIPDTWTDYNGNKITWPTN